MALLTGDRSKIANKNAAFEDEDSMGSDDNMPGADQAFWGLQIKGGEEVAASPSFDLHVSNVRAMRCDCDASGAVERACCWRFVASDV